MATETARQAVPIINYDDTEPMHEGCSCGRRKPKAAPGPTSQAPGAPGAPSAASKSAAGEQTAAEQPPEDYQLTRALDLLRGIALYQRASAGGTTAVK